MNIPMRLTPPRLDIALPRTWIGMTPLTYAKRASSQIDHAQPMRKTLML